LSNAFFVIWAMLGTEPQPKKKGMTFMNARFNPQAEDLKRLQVGPIGPYLQSFAALVSHQVIAT
jgi:hypothetical protein